MPAEATAADCMQTKDTYEHKLSTCSCLHGPASTYHTVHQMMQGRLQHRLLHNRLGSCLHTKNAHISIMACHAAALDWIALQKLTILILSFKKGPLFRSTSSRRPLHNRFGSFVNTMMGRSAVRCGVVVLFAEPHPNDPVLRGLNVHPCGLLYIRTAQALCMSAAWQHLHLGSRRSSTTTPPQPRPCQAGAGGKELWDRPVSHTASQNLQRNNSTTQHAQQSFPQQTQSAPFCHLSVTFSSSRATSA